ncbi:MAG: hypothetical protein ACT4P1_12460 [Sporichthyaceae bacterium]
MDGVLVDPDAIRAAAALLRQQANYVSQMDCYVNSTCKATGAFTGPTVLGLFEGTYENAFRLVADGLQVSLQENHQLADLLEQCAQGYVDADRGSYDAFARIAGPLGWDISAYQPVGSGRVGFAPGSCVTTAAKPAASASDGGPLLGGVPVVGGALGALDSAAAFTSVHVDAHAKRMLGLAAHETVMYRGERIYKDDLPDGAEADPTPKSALDRMENSLEERLKPLDDPFGLNARKEKFGEWFHEKANISGSTIADDLDRRALGVSQSLIGNPDVSGYSAEVARNKAINDGTDKAIDVYDAGKAVLDFRHDQTMGLGGAVKGLSGTWDDLNAAASTRNRMQDIISGGPDPSVRDIAARQART